MAAVDEVFVLEPAGRGLKLTLLVLVAAAKEPKFVV